MGNKVNHYYNGIQWAQLPNGGITDAELTITDGVGGTGSGAVVANRFISMKDSSDTLWILAGTSSSAHSYKAKLFSITSAGVKSMVWLNWAYSGYITDTTSQPQIQESRDGLSILVKGNYNQAAVYMFTKATFATKAGLQDASRIIAPSDTFKTFPACNNIAMYKDQYVWLSISNTLYIYSYNGTQIASIGTYDSQNIGLSPVCDVGKTAGTVFAVSGSGDPFYSYIYKLSNNGTSIEQVGWAAPRSYNYLMIVKVDKWNNVCAMKESSPTILYKFNDYGTLIGSITLGSQCYTFDTDIDGNYFYSNAGGTWMIPANTEAGQAFSAIGTHIKIRNVGMTTYNNSLTGYLPATKG